ncbi:MAG TPA: M48 family metallopeptidase [Pyrinomonadaceae bacterium]|jgi:Zn-dependent protease with chaperone function|nr:M48 family metallopeptidase [Pyrinomonadaceae bacterium]
MTEQTAMATVKPKRIPLKGLPVTAFQHPLDRQATENLKRLRGFDWLVAKFVEYGIERIEYVRNIGGSIRVGPRQLPRHYEMLREACHILDVPEPELYVADGNKTFTSGHNHPFIVIKSGVLGEPDDEIMAVIARELGHIKCGHVLYKMMAREIKPFFEMIDSVTLGIGGLVGAGIEAGLLAWDRRSKLSADRCALLAVQNDAPVLNMLLKLAGGSDKLGKDLSLEQFLLQARAYQEGLDDRLSDRFYRFIANLDGTHPYAVERARAIDEWYDSQEYKDILAGKYGISTMVRARICPNPQCNAPLEANQMFCSQCGMPLSQH